MIIIPAIDLYDKKAVRLYKGDYENMTIYNDNPLLVAKDFEEKGATWVHLVDLEGAKLGTTPNIEVVEAIAKNTNLKIEIGGGIRALDVVEKYFSIGVSRVILGTAAVENRNFLCEAVKKFKEKVAVGADVKDGFIAIKGWLQKSQMTLYDFLDDMQNIGVKNVICTDISKDGAMSGTNLELYKRLAEKYDLQLTASGGVSSMGDVESLAKINLYGAIIGKAYYTGDIDLVKAIEAAK